MNVIAFRKGYGNQFYTAETYRELMYQMVDVKYVKLNNAYFISINKVESSISYKADEWSVEEMMSDFARTRFVDYIEAKGWTVKRFAK